MLRCIFCAIVQGEAPASIFWEDEQLLGFMDIYPWRPGHALVIPKTHAQHISGIPTEVAYALWKLGLRVAAGMRSGAIDCRDVHFLLNDGKAANQTVPHIHLHIIPRTGGDLGRLMAELLKRPFLPLLQPTSRDELDTQANALRAALPPEN